ncbi:DUF4194 domain-containing protein [Paraburkholderia sp. GAS82]|uniref:DUF4194 domain-containing protein n=1 Tax=Paraburkholderia sp. GAS82 TaxID=3035137 RepID=UPI003D1E7226
MQTWETIAASDGTYEAADFEYAAYRIVAEQVLYHADKSSRTAYGIVERYERDFRELLSRLGIDLGVNRHLRYAYAIPRHDKSVPATTAQTLLALVLRGLYDESAQKGDLTDEGEVVCGFVELAQKYQLMTGRELPPKGEFEAAIRILNRWGIVRRIEDEETLQDSEGGSVRSGIAIRPAIVVVLGEAAIARLTSWTRTEVQQQLREEEPDSDREEDGDDGEDFQS